MIAFRNNPILRVAAFSLFVLLLATAFTPAQQVEDPTDVGQFLAWAGTAAGAMVLASFVVERVEWFQGLTAKARGTWVFGLAVAFGFGSYAAYTYTPPAALAAIAPFFRILAGIALAWLASQWAHFFDPLAAARRAE